MSASHSDLGFSGESEGFDSLNSQILIIDGPGDTTIRPSPPHLLPFLLAERERLRRWQQQIDQTHTPDQASEERDRKEKEQD